MAPWVPLLALLATAPSTELYELSTPAIRVFTAGDGLPQSGVRALALDAPGHLWLGTDRGVAVGEGRVFRKVPLPGETTALSVTRILPASDGSIYFATRGKGVYRLRGTEWEHFTEGLPSQNVNRLLEAQGSIWAGTTGGLARLEGKRWAAVTLPVRLDDPNVFALERTADPETLWVGTDSGLLRMRGGAWTFFDERAGLVNKRVHSLLEWHDQDGSRKMLVGTAGGLAQLDGDRFAPFAAGEHLPQFDVYSLAETQTGSGARSLWIGLYGGGAALWRDGRLRVFDSRSGLPSNRVLSILPMSSGPVSSLVWIATDDGLVRLAEGGFRSFPDGPAFLRNKVNALASIDSGPASGVWIAAADSGLFRFAGNRWSQIALPGRSDDHPLSLLAAHDGSLLVGTEQGNLLRFDGRRAELIAFPSEIGNSVRSLFEARDPARGQELWVARKIGLLVRRGEKWTSYDTAAGLKSNWHFAVSGSLGPASERTVWVGGWNGLASFDGARFHALDHNDGLPVDVVTWIFQDARARHPELWVGTMGGAALFDLQQKKWTIFSESSDPPLPDDSVFAIVSDRQERIYLCTNKGVARIARDGRASVAVFAKEDGLPSAECNEHGAMTDAEGRVWVAMGSGVAVLDPSLEPPPSGPKPLRIERTLLLGKPHDLADARLGHRQNALQFEYALLSYFRADETRFRTQLAGLEPQPTEWTADAKREFATLPAGSYEFRVWGRDYAGNVSGPEVRRFTIARPPWASIWAIALYALGGVGLAAGATKWRTRALERRAAALEERVAQRTKELDERNKELIEANEDLVASQKHADRIFSALAEVLEGKVLDERYRLEEQIGRGGFGAVYRATDLTTNTPVAVKVFRPQPGNDSAEAMERFRQEAQSGAQVAHKNAVAVLGTGVSSDGILYLVMQLLEGRSLKSELFRVGKMPPARAVGITVQMLDALAEAHRKGIIHRDIKPENVFLHREGDGEIVKVVDFGVAKMKDGGAHGSLTMTGAVVGTPLYMAPERLDDKPYDGRSDVYSVGILLYEMLSGQPPFDSKGGNLWSLVLMHVKQPPRPLRDLDPSIPSGLSDVVLAALAKDPAQRPTAERMAEMLIEASRPPRPTVSERRSVES